MGYRWGADAVALLHFGFVLFVILGGFLVVRWPRVAWAHLPAVVWGAAIEFAGWLCPLTPLENWLRRQGGEAGYSGGFVESYLVPILYPHGLTRGLQIGLGVAVLVVNITLYGWILIQRRSDQSR